MEKTATLNRQLNLQIAKSRSSDARACLAGARGPQKSSRGPRTARHHQVTEPTAYPRKLHLSKSQSKYAPLVARPSFDSAGNYLGCDPTQSTSQPPRQHTQDAQGFLSKSNSALLSTNGIYDTRQPFFAKTQAPPSKDFQAANAEYHEKTRNRY